MRSLKHQIQRSVNKYILYMYFVYKFVFDMPIFSIAADYPDIEIVAGVGGLSGDTSGAMRNMVGITDEFYYKVYRDIIGKPAFGLVPVLLRPFSRGRISLKSKNPFRWPRMDPNFFTDQRDIDVLTKGIRAVITMLD